MEKAKPDKPRSAAPRRRPPTSNYYRSGASGTSAADSPFAKKVKSSPRLRKFLNRALDATVGLILLIGLGYSLVVNPTPKIRVNNTFYHSMDNYRDSTRNHLMSLKNRNKITFDERSIVNALVRDYPEIQTASVELPVFSQRPIVNIKIDGPAFILAAQGRNYLIDANGKAVGLTSNFNKSAGLPIIIDQSNFPVAAGRTVLSSSDVAFIRSLLAEAGKAGVKFDSLALPSAPAELDAKPAGKSYIVKFYLAGDAPLQIGQFLAATHQFSTGGDQPTQYLDVRVSGKIFYK